VYEELGWSYRILDRADIREPAIVFANSREIQIDGPLTIEYGEIDKVRAIFACAERAEVPLARIAEALGGWVRGSCIARAMMVRRILRIPLDRRITRETPVTLVTQGADLRRLAEHHR
jgi:hypothetical protein